MSLSVDEVNSIEELASRRSTWDALLTGTDGADFLRTFDWLAVHWRHLDHGLRLRVLVVQDDRRTLGIWPLAVLRRQTRVGPLRVLSYPLDHWGTAYGPFGHAVPRAVAAGAEHLGRTPSDWDIVDLPWTTASDASVIESACRSAGLPMRRTAAAERSWIDVAQGWQAYWSSRPARLRENVRRYERRLARTGRFELLHCRPGSDDPRWDVFHLCERVAKASWQAGSTHGNTLTTKQVHGLFGEMHFAAAMKRGVSMHVLMVDRQPAAFAYNYLFAGRAFGLRAGYDSRFADASPGTVLLARMLEFACTQGDRSLDLGETPAAYKRWWRTHKEPTFRLRHFRRGAWRPQVLRWVAAARSRHGSFC